MKTVRAAQQMHVLLAVVVILHLGTSVALQTDALWRHIRWRTLRVPLTPGRCIWIEMIPLNHTTWKVPPLFVSNSNGRSIPTVAQVALGDVGAWSCEFGSTGVVRQTLDRNVRPNRRSQQY